MAKDFQRLWDDVKSANDETKAVRVLAEIVTEKDGRVFVLQFGREDAAYCINILGRGIAGNHLKTTVGKQGFFVTLRRLAGTHGRLPDSMVITENVRVEDKIVASGGFADVRRGRLMGHLVAVKTLRITESDNTQRIRKQFCKEVVLWSTLSHPHVLKLRGTYGDVKRGQLTTISEWMANGNIMEFIKKNHVNRLGLLCGAAQGLKYVHDAGLAHGDLKGANILMSNDKPPRACLADFGFMTVVLDPHQPMSCSPQLEGGTIPFMPPEILVPSEFGVTDPIPTPEADIYGFGMVILQVLTGEVPFRHARQAELAYSVVHGLRPEKPADAPAIGFSESLWSFVQRCWYQDRNLRPTVADVVKQLTSAVASWHRLMPPCSQPESVAPFSEEAALDTLRHGRIFAHDSTVSPESPTNSQISLFSRPGPPSTVSTDSLRDDPEVILTKPLMEPPVDFWGSPQSSIPPPKAKPSRREVVSPSQERSRHLHGAVSQRVTQPSIAPPKNHMLGVNVSQASHDPSGSLSGLLNQVIRSPENQFREAASNFKGEDLVQFASLLDSILRSPDPTDSTFRTHLPRLRWVCGAREILPQSCDISDRCLSADDPPFASGILTDVYKGSLDDTTVRVEKVRLYSNCGGQEVKTMFLGEAVTWKYLNHKNIVPFLGATLDPPQLVSAWMPHGDLMEYLTAHPESNRLSLLCDVTLGMEYLHSRSVVHGSLKGQNILVDGAGRACIAGFELAVVGLDMDPIAPFTEAPTEHLTAPEILAGETTVSKEADIFSLAMVMIEVFTGATPFANIPPHTISVRILEGKRPDRPAHRELTDGLWDLNGRCWDQKPQQRPAISEVVSCLQAALDAQGGHPGGSDISSKHDTVSSSSRQTGALRFVRWPSALGIPHKLPEKRKAPSGSPGSLRRRICRFSTDGPCASLDRYKCTNNIAEKHDVSKSNPSSVRKELRSSVSLKAIISQLVCFP